MNGLPKGMVPPAPAVVEAPTIASAPRFFPAMIRLLAGLENALAADGITVHVERMEADAAGGAVRVALVMRVEEVNGDAGPVPRSGRDVPAAGE